MSGLRDLSSLSLDQMTALVTEFGQPAFRARQLYRWVYHSSVPSIPEMTNLPASLREELSANCTLPRLQVEKEQRSSDQTIKSLFRLESGRLIESVLIPDFASDEERYGGGSATRLTVCVSSQVGCAMACSFCATGRMGFHQNLTAGEILEQVRRLDQQGHEVFGRGVSNVVFMGMGEPLQNYDEVVRSVGLMHDADGLGLSFKRITISTVGLARRIRRLADDGVEANLAISLHAPEDAKRSSIMPVNRAARTDLDALREAVTYYAETTSKRVTYEYCMFEGFNDTVEDAKNLADVCRWAPSKVNLIMYNPVPGSAFSRTTEAGLNDFIRELVNRDVRVTVRRSRGQDIAAACGQLAADTGQEAA
jgi:23S rRNA (adenine2503-C2)-methyltransferase